MPGLDPARLVFIDETGAKTNMARTHGYAPKGQRLVEAVPHGHWHTTTFVGALTARGFVAPMVVDGAINGDLFRAYVEKVLVPGLRPGDVVVLDNLGSHTVAGIREAVARREELVPLGLAHAARFSWERTGAAMLAALEERA